MVETCEKDVEQTSIAQLLDHSVHEITSKVAKMEIKRIPSTSKAVLRWNCFLVRTKGDYRAMLAMSAEESVFYEIARRMKGKSEVSEADIAVYVTEYYNILCGYFISAFNRRKKLKARFGIPEFIKGQHIQGTDLGHESVSFFYQSAWGLIHICAVGFPL